MANELVVVCLLVFATITFYNNNNIVIKYLTANRLSPGGSGYYACT